MFKLLYKKPFIAIPKYGNFLLGILCGWMLSRLLQGMPMLHHSILVSTNWSAPASSAINLTESVRVLCWIMTTPENHQSKVVHLQQTWGARCNKLLIMSSVADPSVGSIALPVVEGRQGLWNKTREALRYIYEHHLEGYDWFLKADDDTYVVMENLRYFLYAYSPALPIYFGSKFRYPDYVKQGYFSGGAGYVMSREAVRRFYDKALEDEALCPLKREVEDLELGKCMEGVNVTAGDSRDELGRKRFLPFQPVDHLTGSVSDDPEYWYNLYSYYEPIYGKNCCSNLAISFHYIDGKRMHMMEYLVYSLHAWGKQWESPPLPRKKTLEEALTVAGPYPLSTKTPTTSTTETAATLEDSSKNVPIS